MTESVLTETFGDSVNLRILSFFVENPFDQYSISEISEFSGVSRNSVYKYLEFLLDKEYVNEETLGSRKYYGLNSANDILKHVNRFIDMVGEVFLEPVREIPAEPVVQIIDSRAGAPRPGNNQVCWGVA